jgi:hypothetical protein
MENNTHTQDGLANGENNKVLKDILGFLNWVASSDKTQEEKYSLIQTTLPHDLRGILVQDKWFSPRVSGYNKYI